MVAWRTVETSSPAKRRAMARRLFDTWRRMLAMATVPMVDSYSAIVNRARISTTTIRDLLSPEAGAVSSDKALRVGVTAILIGVAGSTLAGTLSSTSVIRSFAVASSASLWPLARLVVIRALAPRHRIEIDSATIAWGGGSILYALAVTPSLRVAAWLLGSVLGYRSLRTTDADSKDARSLVLWSWGIEVVGAIAIWLTQGASLIALGLG